ncbi:DsrE family protein [Cytophagales bacterium LB-30]|uniref:DsrE family protein n=1 Tax=Shiella aurantiaca TaxID=3058365 RepID=A0ABT8F2X5_9BACT|nr:DsrE family protein [Shiella aurantiaca]MDN4164805.1 DsrE family protein [Shiella aurantiaca]
MRIFLLTSLLSLMALSGWTQENSRPHKVVVQLTTSDTLAYRALTKQLANMMKMWPEAEVEVVIHNKGLAMMKSKTSNVAPQVKTLTEKGVRFVVCEFSLQQQKISKDEILSDAKYTPYGLIEIVSKQEEGYAYLKAGF